MTILKSKSLLMILLLSLPAFSFQQQNWDIRAYRQQALAAYRAKDYATSAENLKKVIELIPDYPSILYYLAAVDTLLGKKEEALEELRKVARMRLYLPAEKEENFNPIKDSPEFKAILKQFTDNLTPVVKSSEALILKEKGLVAEGLAFDSVSHTLFVSSVHKRKILAVNKNGETRTFADEHDGLWSVLGMKVDEKRRTLWAVTAGFSQMQNFNKEDEGKSAVLKFDLKTGKLVKNYLVPDNTNKHALGDLIVNSRGEVYTTDSLSPAVYVIHPERDEIELLMEGEPFVSPQGLAFSPDESHLFIAEYSKGIFDVDVKTKRVNKLPPVPDATLLGIDGLYYYQGALVGVQNGVSPWRVIRMKLSRDFRSFENCEILESNNPKFAEPTLAVIVKGELLLIANSQWDAITDEGRFTSPEKLQDLTILKLKL